MRRDLLFSVVIGANYLLALTCYAVGLHGWALLNVTVAAGCAYTWSQRS